MQTFNNKLFAERLRAKRGKRSLRLVAQELDMGHATLSRAENGKLLDLENFFRVCDWLGEKPETFMMRDESDQETPLSIQLRAAQGMSTETAEAFVEILRAVYAQVLEQTSDDERA